VSVVCLLTALSGCTAQAAPENSSSRGDAPAGQSSVAPARQGRPAASQRIEFIPERLTLPGHATAGVLPAVTVDGVLRVPEATEGIGFFARLLKIKAGDTITLRADSHQLKYRVTSVRTVAKKALATDSQAFRQTGPHRLVLITCTGNFHRDRGGYDSNLVVVGKPLGVAR
jgi:hypothetical protein